MMRGHIDMSDVAEKVRADAWPPRGSCGAVVFWGRAAWLCMAGLGVQMAETCGGCCLAPDRSAVLHDIASRLLAISPPRTRWTQCPSMQPSTSPQVRSGSNPMHCARERAVLQVNAALDQHFPEGCGVEIIAEPGRFFTEHAGTLHCQVMGKRVIETRLRGARGGRWTTVGMQYFLTDGVYGSFNNIFYDHYECRKIHPIPTGATPPGMEQPSTLFGPTCDGADTIVKDFPLPEVQVWPEIALCPSVDAVLGSERERCHCFGSRGGRRPGSAPVGGYHWLWCPAAHAAGSCARTCTMPSNARGVNCGATPAVLHAQVGDFLAFPEMGAYSLAGATDFNGIRVTNADKFYVFSLDY